MRGITRATLAGAACAICIIGTTAAAQAANADEVLICHGTASDTNPYVLISVSENAADTHLIGHGENNHPDFLLPGSWSDCSGGPELTGGE
jgi:hypothetical protein